MALNSMKNRRQSPMLMPVSPVLVRSAIAESPPGTDGTQGESPQGTSGTGSAPVQAIPTRWPRRNCLNSLRHFCALLKKDADKQLLLSPGPLAPGPLVSPEIVRDPGFAAQTYFYSPTKGAPSGHPTAP